MIERICADPTLDITLDEIKEILIPSKYIGRCIDRRKDSSKMTWILSLRMRILPLKQNFPFNH